MSKLSRNIKRLRVSAKLTQSELSWASGIPQGAISNLESGGTKSPGIYVIASLARALGVTVEKLLK